MVMPPSEFVDALVGVLGELTQNVTTSKQLKVLEYFSLLFLKALKLLSIRVW